VVNISKIAKSVAMRSRTMGPTHATASRNCTHMRVRCEQPTWASPPRRTIHISRKQSIGFGGLDPESTGLTRTAHA